MTIQVMTFLIYPPITGPVTSGIVVLILRVVKQEWLPYQLLRGDIPGCRKEVGGTPHHPS